MEDAGAEPTVRHPDEKGGPMSTRDTIAQLNQDITTAEDAGNEAEAARLRRELATALRAAADPNKSADTE